MRACDGLLRLITTSPVAAILQPNRVFIDDGVAEIEPFEQTTGLAQGDSLSPLLFALLLRDLPPIVKGVTGRIKVILYADDVVVYGNCLVQVQKALVRLQTLSRSLGLTINQSKTEALKFRRGGRIASGDQLHIDGHQLKFVNSFRYLGVNLPHNGKSFTAHLTERCAKALVAAHQIQNPQKLSLNTAMRLYDLKVAPVVSYNIEMFWDDLTVGNLEMLNKVKASFIKRTLGLHPTTRSRLAYLLAGSMLAIEDFRARFGLRETDAYRDCLEAWETKFAEVDPEFHSSWAMKQEKWKEPHQENRNVVTRYSVHGFHFKLCTNKSFHEALMCCICRRCSGQCNKYHAATCPCVPSLNALANGCDETDA